MNCLNIMFLCMLCIGSNSNFIKLKKVLLLENDFLDVDKERRLSKHDYLFRIDISLEDGSLNHKVNYHKHGCHYLESTKFGYLQLPDGLSKDLIYSLKFCKENIFLKIDYLFTNEELKDCLSYNNYKGGEKIYQSHLIPKKISENHISLEHDGIETCKFYIKEMFKGFVNMRLLKLAEYISKLSVKGPKEGLKRMKCCSKIFLYHFRNHSKCLDSLVDFMTDFQRFKLVRDDDSETFIDKKTTMKVSEFIEVTNEMFKEDILHLEIKQPFFDEITKIMKSSNEECRNHIINEIIEKKMLFIITDKYDIRYYLLEITKSIYKSLEAIQRKYDVTSPKEKRFVSRGMIKLLDSDLRKTQEKIIKSICVPEYVHKYFSKLLKRKITTLTDYAIVEEIICDYYNMLTNIYNTINKKTNSAFVLHPFFSPSPASFDYYHVRIVSGIEISFDNLAEIGSFSAFDNNGVVSFKKNFDFWVCGRNKLYFISEILKTRNILEIEVVSSDKKEIMRFDIKDYLNI